MKGKRINRCNICRLKGLQYDDLEWGGGTAIFLILKKVFFNSVLYQKYTSTSKHEKSQITNFFAFTCFSNFLLIMIMYKIKNTILKV